MRLNGRSEYNNYIKNYLKRRYDERRSLAIQILGGRCVKCGATDDLQFDHIVHEQKSFDIADRLAQYTWKRILEELKKCQLLCSKCHNKKSGIEQSRRLRAKRDGITLREG